MSLTTCASYHLLERFAIFLLIFSSPFFPLLISLFLFNFSRAHFILVFIFKFPFMCSALCVGFDYFFVTNSSFLLSVRYFLVVFFSSPLLHVIFICIHIFFNDIFLLVLFSRFNFLSFVFILFFNYSIYLSFFYFFCFIFFILSTVYILPYIKKN